MSRFINIDQIFTDNSTGAPLALGTVYFGLPNQDPVTNPKQPYSNSALSTPISATQTLTAAGKFAQPVYLSGDYSVTVKNAAGAQIFTAATVNELFQFSGSAGATLIGYGATTVAGALDALAASLVSLAREKLYASRTYYVSTTGSNSNSGLTALLPFQTIQYAYDYIMSNIDFAGQVVVIQLANGTYTSGLASSRGGVGQGGPEGLIIRGNTSDRTLTKISTAGDCIKTGGGTTGCAMISVEYVELVSSGGNLLVATGGGINFGPVRFGACPGAHISSAHSAFVIQYGNAYQVTGSAAQHAAAATNGTVAIHGASIDFIGGPYTFDAFVQASSNGCVFVNDMGFTNGSLQHGRRFNATGGGQIVALGGHPLTYLPGDLPGIANNGGYYDTFNVPAPIEVITATITVTQFSQYFLVDATAGNIIITLPAATAYDAGMEFGFNRIDGSGNTVTIKRSDGTTLTTMASNTFKTYKSYTSNWYQFS